MGNLHLVTGYAGEAHVASSDQGSLFEALIRSGQFVMDAGAKFAASIVSNNQIRVGDGELMMQGRHVKLTPGAYVDLTIENGTQGYLRNDLVVVRYTKNSDTGIEECSLVVIKGTPAEANPADPKYTTGIINANGAMQHDYPLYRVNLSGLSIEGITALFKTEKSLYDSLLRLTGGTMAGDIEMAGHKVTGLGTPTANGDAVSLGYAKEKFASAGYISGKYTVSSETEANSILSGVVADMADETVRFIRIEPTSGAFLVGQAAVCMVYKRQKDWATASFTSFGAGGNTFWEKSFSNGVWQPLEWVNPPLVFGEEYRTTERYQNAAVYKKVDASGNILWRKNGDSQWHLLSSASYVAAATVE